MSDTLCLDIGGTKIAAGIVDGKGRVVDSVRRNHGSPPYEDLLRIIGMLADRIRERNPDRVFANLCCGIPGAVNRKRNIVLAAPNLPCIVGRNAAVDIERVTGTPVFLENDGNLAAFGEYFFHYRETCESLLSLTLGTGVGGGVVLNGRLLSGETNTAFELGHIKIRQAGRKCGCGGRGCLEAYASSAALVREMSRRTGSSSTTNQIIRGFRDKDPRAVEAVEAYSGYIGTGLASLVNIFMPQIIVISGGLSNLGKDFLTILDKDVRGNIMEAAGDIRILLSKNRENSVLVGCAAYGSGL